MPANRRRTRAGIAFVLSFFTLTAVDAPASAESISLDLDGAPSRVSVTRDSAVILVSPEEGLWSIATDWQDGRPATWVHGQPSEKAEVGEWRVLSGVVETSGGAWKVSDRYRMRDGLVEGMRRFQWTGDKPIDRCTLSVRFMTPGRGAGVVMPGILYHGNPSGARSGRTPVYTGAPGEAALFEEHRFPMPFVNIEWPEAGEWRMAALHSLPSPVPFAHLADQWWSMGVQARESGTELCLLSGPCASNGKWSVVKGHQPGFVPYDEAWLTVPPGAIIEKSFLLQAGAAAGEGQGFRPATAASMQLFSPAASEDMPGFDEIIRAKYRYAKTRWYEKGPVAGFRKYPDKDIFVMGWCGQADALGYALPILGDRLNDEGAADKARRALDFLSGAEFYDGGFHTWYHCDKGTWEGEEPLSQGQAMLSFANAIRTGRERGVDTTRWEAFLRHACDVHAARILDGDWRPNSTDQAFFIAPLCAASRLFDVPAYRDAAEKAGRVYAERHLAMREPYWGGTLDASCEDKEGAFAALQGFLALHELTQDPKYLEWAGHACDVVLTYVVVWDIDLPPGRLRDHAFKTRGWTAVSVQNMHIDVFGVLIAPFVYRCGQLAGRADLEELALLMYRSCGQLIDAQGSQGEQPQHTNYTQHGQVESVAGLRGGYVEDWTVFWITAHFLNAAAMFQELGAPIRPE